MVGQLVYVDFEQFSYHNELFSNQMQILVLHAHLKEILCVCVCACVGESERES